ncbi:MAG: cyclic nucleotide-binding domain-containing protein [Candidatus Cloacimonetes bacterium]|nr:cyclic nucleotide-binding domain-containing protein [Candidatus Cloacimonadota bacterium]
MSIYQQQNLNPLLKYLDKNEMNKVAPFIKTEKYQDGDLIISLGDRNRDILIINKGLAAILILDENVVEKKVTELPEGEIIGDQNFVIPVRRSANVKAVGEVDVSRFPYDEMIELLREETLIASKIFSAINDSLAEKMTRTMKKYLEKEEKIQE